LLTEAQVSLLREFDTSFEGTNIHYWRGGSGKPLIFLHGSGAGVGTMSNFRKVLDPLSRDFEIVAADLIGFGKSGRRVVQPYYDIEMWTRQVQHLMGFFPADKIGLIGHSLSGSIALKVACRNPKVSGVLTTGTTGARSEEVKDGPRWTFPDGREQIRQQVERTLFNKSLAEEEEINNRLTVLSAPGYREYFEKMFSRERSFYLNEAALTSEELAGIECSVVLMHGANDASFKPAETSLLLAKGIPRADVVVLAECAHSVALEYPEKFIANVRLLWS
jgi:2-hydroxymuconate-semialdehyde hydrolase